MTTRRYVFKVEDAEGLWGEASAHGETEEDARIAAIEFLEGELEPDGSLLPDFALTLLVPAKGTEA